MEASERLQQEPHRYLIMESGLPSSFDPLDADATQNLPVARMLYLTPIEVSLDDRLRSTVLETFDYDKANTTIHWRVRTGLTYADGSAVSVDDVVLSVLRMAAKRPLFPVIKEIAGIQSWAAQKMSLASLPVGIKVAGNDISIKLTRNVDHPLFRFCLEIFSIIPSRCVDKSTNALTCKTPPASGYYSLSEVTADRLDFLRRDPTASFLGQAIPAHIRFEYQQSASLLAGKALEGAAVAAVNESLFSAVEVQKIHQRYQVTKLPRSRFSGFLLNTKAAPFLERKCRLVFAERLRESYRAATNGLSEVEGSISPKVAPGYTPLDELAKGNPLAAADEARCSEALRHHPIHWAVFPGARIPAFEAAVKQTLESFGQREVEPILCANRAEMDGLFLSGKVHLVRMSSGLWPLDPFGDLQMLFTPGLHKTLEHQQNDKLLQGMIADLRDELPPAEKLKIARQLNAHLYSDAAFNILDHISRFYVSNGTSVSSTLPASITSPAPWQVFKTP